MARALGMIEVEGVAGIIVAADAACKAASVDLDGWESIGGFTTVFFRGAVGDIESALRAGTSAAADVTGHVESHSLLQPESACDNFISARADTADDSIAEADALGLVETRGYGVHIENNDRMIKEASVDLINVLTVHNRVVCSLVTGELGAVERAIDRTRDALASSEWFMGTAVLSQPQPSTLQAFGQTPKMGGN